MHGKIKYLNWIERADLRKNPSNFFLFGDNIARAGLGGQAAEMRGESNAIGIATKRRPNMHPDSFFSDLRVSDRMALLADLSEVELKLAAGYTVICPSSGLGTGLSELPIRAPLLYSNLKKWFQMRSENNECPWSY